jgi:hypothetical protein
MWLDVQPRRSSTERQDVADIMGAGGRRQSSAAC